jgi:enterochelin esterase-like enzyme
MNNVDRSRQRSIRALFPRHSLRALAHPAVTRTALVLTVLAVFAIGIPPTTEAKPIKSKAKRTATKRTSKPTAVRTTVDPNASTPVESIEHFTTSSGIVIDYVRVVPPGRRVGQPGKVLLAFPPGGQDLSLTKQLVDSRWRDEAIKRDWVVVSPAAPSSGLFYKAESIALIPEFVAAVRKEFPVANEAGSNRIDLAGVSNGGLSAFGAALAYSELFRSLVVFPGYSPSGAKDPELVRLKGIGVSMFVGGDDSGWRTASEQTAAILKKNGKVELQIVEGEGHIISTLTGKDLFDALERVRG